MRGKKKILTLVSGALALLSGIIGIVSSNIDDQLMDIRIDERIDKKLDDYEALQERDKNDVEEDN